MASQRLDDVLAGVAELVDAPDLGSGAARRGGASPFTRTINIKRMSIYLLMRLLVNFATRTRLCDCDLLLGFGQCARVRPRSLQ